MLQGDNVFKELFLFVQLPQKLLVLTIPKTETAVGVNA